MQKQPPHAVVHLVKLAYKTQCRIDISSSANLCSVAPQALYHREYHKVYFQKLGKCQHHHGQAKQHRHASSLTCLFDKSGLGGAGGVAAVVRGPYCGGAELQWAGCAEGSP